jgi:tetratricopeptide (TPR) repeat protein
MNILQEAIEKIENGDVSEGLELLTKFKKTANDSEQFEIAETYFRYGLVEEAKQVIEELLQKYPDEGELLVFAAECYVDLDKEEEAINLLNEIEEDDAEYLRALLLLADLYQIQGLEEVAEQKLLLAKRRAPKEPIILFALAEFYLAKGSYLEAVPYYKNVLETADKFADINIKLRVAEALSASGAFEEALSYYEEGLKATVELNALFGYGFTAFQLEEFQRSIKAFSELKELDSQYSTLYPYLAKSYEKIGAVEEALQTLKEGILVDEYNEELYLAAAQLSLQSGNSEQAEQYYRNFLALNPSSIKGAKEFAGFLKKKERYDDMIELIEQLKEMGEEDPFFDWTLAYAFYQEEQYEKALEFYEKALVHYDQDVEFLEEYGKLLIEEGRPKEALQLFKRALQGDESLIHLEELIYELEDRGNY